MLIPSIQVLSKSYSSKTICDNRMTIDESKRMTNAKSSLSSWTILYHKNKINHEICEDIIWITKFSILLAIADNKIRWTTTLHFIQSTKQWMYIIIDGIDHINCCINFRFWNWNRYKTTSFPSARSSMEERSPDSRPHYNDVTGEPNSDRVNSRRAGIFRVKPFELSPLS